MIYLIRNGFFKKDETVLFLHTGGQPALFANEYRMLKSEINIRLRTDQTV